MNATAEYHAMCWAIGKSKAKIKAEIQRIESLWTSKHPTPFPKSANDSYSRMEALKVISERLTD